MEILHSFLMVHKEFMMHGILNFCRGTKLSTLFISFFNHFYCAGAIYQSIPDTDTEESPKRKIIEEVNIHSIWKQQFVNALMVPPYFFLQHIFTHLCFKKIYLK